MDFHKLEHIQNSEGLSTLKCDGQKELKCLVWKKKDTREDMIVAFMWKKGPNGQREDKIQLACVQGQQFLTQYAQELMADKQSCLKWNEVPYETAVYVFFQLKEFTQCLVVMTRDWA